MQHFLTKFLSLRAVVVLIACVLTLALGLVWVFHPTTEKSDPEPNYNYLWKQEDMNEIYVFQRPIAFPLLLKLTHLTESSFPTYLILQYFFRSSAILMFGYLVYRMTNSRLSGALTASILFLNLQVQQYINYLIPEIFVTFLLAANFLAIYSWIQNEGKAQATSNLVITFLLLTFTKPVFLYYPIIFIGIYAAVLVLRRLQAQHFPKTTKPITLLIAYFFTFYVVPVLLWSYMNYVRHDYFVFSSVPELNFATRVMRLKLSPKSPLSEPEQKVKEIFENSQPHEDIFWVWWYIAQITPGDMDIQTLIGKYARKTVSENLFEYVKLSMNDWVYVTSHIPTLPVHFSYYDFTFNQTWWTYMAVYENVWSRILAWRVLIVVLSVALGTWIMIKHRRDMPTAAFFLLYAPLTWAYGAGTLIFSTDGDVVRQRSTVDDALAVSLILLLVLGARHLWVHRPKPLLSPFMDEET